MVLLVECCCSYRCAIVEIQRLDFDRTGHAIDGAQGRRE